MRPFDPGAWVRPHLKDAPAYSTARDEFSGRAHVFLDANENASGSVIDDDGNDLSRYPDPKQRELRAAVGGLLGVAADHVFLGNGSDEAIDLLIRLFCAPGADEILIVEPTYAVYEVFARLHDVGVVRSRLRREDYSLDPAAVLGAVTDRVKLVFLCSPNNPTGNLLGRGEVAEVVAGFPGPVVVDEAYVDFSPGGSVLGLRDSPNLVVLRTFSKAWGLAALRLGVAVARPEVVSFLDKVKLPYNLGAATARLGLRAVGRSDAARQSVAAVVRERAAFAEALGRLGRVRTVYPSDANFLLVRTDDAAGDYRRLLDAGIVVRDRSRVVLCEGCLRITVGTADENRAVVSVLGAGTE